MCILPLYVSLLFGKCPKADIDVLKISEQILHQARGNKYILDLFAFICLLTNIALP